MKYNEKGEELPDPTPVALPVGFRRPPNIHEMVQRLVRNELSRRAESAGAESFEEADDFDLPEDPVDPTTPYEEDFDPEHPGIIARDQEIKSGFVEDIPLEKKTKARETVTKAKSLKSKPHAKHEGPKAKPKGDVSRRSREEESDDEDMDE